MMGLMVQLLPAGNARMPADGGLDNGPEGLQVPGDFQSFIQQLGGDSGNLSKLLDELSGLLNPEQQAQLEQLLADGKGLPAAAKQLLSMLQQALAELRSAASAELAAADALDDPEQADDMPVDLPALIDVPIQRLDALMQALARVSQLSQQTSAEVDKLLQQFTAQLGQRSAGETQSLQQAVTGAAADRAVAVPLPSASSSVVAQVVGSDLAALAGAGSAATTAGLAGNNGLPGSAAQLATQTTPPPLTQSVFARDWGEGVGQRISWMIGKKLQSAEIRLSPPHLGPLELKVAVHQDQATVSLNAANAVVRDALEQALPRLREMLAEQNIQLADAQVGTPKEQHGRGGSASGHHAGSEDDGNEFSGLSEEEVAPVVRMSSNRLVDAFV